MLKFKNHLITLFSAFSVCVRVPVCVCVCVLFQFFLSFFLLGASLLIFSYINILCFCICMHFMCMHWYTDMCINEFR